MAQIAPTELSDIVAFLFAHAGASPDIAREAADCLVEADLYAHHSHGTRHASSYVQRLQKGEIDGTARPRVVSDTGTLIHIDGRRAFGPIAGALSAEMGAAAAKRHGVAAVSLTDSGHLGRNGRWPEIAAAQGVASVHFVNAPASPSAVVPFGSKHAKLTNNPISLGAPGPDGQPIVTDFAIGAMAVNAIRRAHDRNERLPEACVVSEDGTLTDDPAVFLNAKARAMLPFGGFKGYALGVFADIFAGAIAGGGAHVREPEPGAMILNNMLSFYIDAGAFGGIDAYLGAVGDIGDFVRGAEQMDPAATTAMPGDRARAAYERQKREGIEFDQSLRTILVDAAKRAGVADEARAKWPDRFD